jgi:hypothetical protein
MVDLGSLACWGWRMMRLCCCEEKKLRWVLQVPILLASSIWLPAALFKDPS